MTESLLQWLETAEDYYDDAETLDVVLDDCCVAIVDYAAASVDELDLYEGQVVCVIDDSDLGEYLTIL